MDFCGRGRPRSQDVCGRGRLHSQDNMAATARLLACLAVGLLLCTGCGRSGKARTDGDGQAEVRPEVETRKVRHIVRQFPVYEDFNCITNISSLHVVYEQGPCSVTAEGDSVIVSNLLYSNDSGGVTFSLASEENFDMAQYDMASCATIRVSSPRLRIVANCGAGTISCRGRVEGDEVLMGGIGSGLVEADTVVCRVFRFESNKLTDGRFGHIACEEGRVLNYGSARVEATVEASRLAIFDVGNKGSLSVAARAPRVEWVSTGSGDSRLLCDTPDLSLSHQGTGTVTLEGHAVMKDIKKGSRSKLVNRLHMK